MVVDNFPWNKKNMKATKKEPLFYKLFISKIANAADKKFEEHFDATSKQMKLHFYGIPDNVLCIVKEDGAFDSSNTVPMYRELIGKILSLGIVDSALLNKSYLKKDQEASLKIIFRVIAHILSRISNILDNSDYSESEEVLTAKIREISEEEWSSASYEKVERSLNKLHDCSELIKFRKLQHEKRAKQRLLKEKARVSETSVHEKTSSSSSEVLHQKSESSSSGVLQIAESNSNYEGEDEKESCFDTSSGYDEKSLEDKMCVKHNDEALCSTPPPQLTPTLCVTPSEEELCLASPPLLSPMNVKEEHAVSSEHSLLRMPILVSILPSCEESSAVETSDSLISDDKQASPSSTEDANLSCNKEPSPEIEFIKEIHRRPHTPTLMYQMKRARLERSPVFNSDNSIIMEASSSGIERCKLIPSVTGSAPPKSSVSVGARFSPLNNFPRTISSISTSISSTTEQGVHPFQRNMMPTGIPPRLPASVVMPFSNRPIPGLPTAFNNTPRFGSHQPTPSTSGNMPNAILQAHRLAEIGTLMGVLNKFATELASQVMESYEPLPGAISFKCSMGNPATSLFVGFSTRQDNDLFECRFWALVHLYQSLQLIFPSFVLDDIRTSAINGSWVKIDKIIYNCKPLFKYAVGKISEMAPKSRFSSESELQLLLQQRLLITQAIENASRSFWAIPSTSTVAAPRIG